jgi:hypothetical protein
MHDFVTGQQALDMPIHLTSIDPPFLTSSPQGVVPVTAHLGGRRNCCANSTGDGDVEFYRQPQDLRSGGTVQYEEEF